MASPSRVPSSTVEMDEDSYVPTNEFTPVNPQSVPQPVSQQEVGDEMFPQLSTLRRARDVSYEERMEEFRRLNKQNRRRRAPSVNSVVSEHPSNLVDRRHHPVSGTPLVQSASDLATTPSRRGLAAAPDFNVVGRVDLTGYDPQDFDVFSDSAPPYRPPPSYDTLPVSSTRPDQHSSRFRQPALLPPRGVRQAIQPEQAAPAPQRLETPAVHETVTVNPRAPREPTAGSIRGPQNPTPGPGASASLSLTPRNESKLPPPEVSFL